MKIEHVDVDPSDVVEFEQQMRDIIGERDRIDNRRYALDRALQFYKNTNPGVICAEAVLGIADLFCSYIQDGEVPDVEQARAVTHELVNNLVRASFTPSIREQLNP